MEVGSGLAAGTDVPIVTAYVVKAPVVLFPLTTVLDVLRSFGVFAAYGAGGLT